MLSVHTCIQGWPLRPEESKCPASPLSALFSKTGSLTDHGARLVASKLPVFLLPLNPTYSLGFQKPAPYIDTEDLNSDLDVFTASSLSHETQETIWYS